MTLIKKEKTKSAKKAVVKAPKEAKKAVVAKPKAKVLKQEKIVKPKVPKVASVKRKVAVAKKKEPLEVQRPVAKVVSVAPQVLEVLTAPVSKPAEPVVKPHKDIPVKEVAKEAVAAPSKVVLAPAPAVASTVMATPVVTPAVDPVAASAQLKELELKLPINVKDLSVKMQEKSSNLIKVLMGMKVMAGINQLLDEEVVAKVCDKFGFKIKKALDDEGVALRAHHELDKTENLHPRFPIVTFMGHVDHGKTSLLDAIRKAKVAELEHGGITQHIGAYRVVLPNGEITFLDTPGHEAFTAMRARGASITDIVVLVVAADEGIMPQTQEAIDHAKAANVPIIVAANKIDKPGANLDRIKKQLSDLDLKPEDWGGKTITVGVSAKTGEGIDTLLEMILLEAQMLELRADPNKLARGVVVEAKLSKGKGIVTTLLVQNGTLRLNENIIVGQYYGKIKAMFDDHAKAIDQAGPSTPVEILGLSGVPAAGEQFFVIDDEKKAKELSFARQAQARHNQQMAAPKKISLEDLYSQIKEGKIKELKIIIKSDVQGSLEAIKETLSKFDATEIKLQIIHEGVGNINYSDAVLAIASNALILGFNVVVDERSKDIINKEGVDVRTYNIIYELANDIKSALEGMLEPKSKKVFLGKAEVRKVFKLSKSGIIAGCYVTKGKFNRTVVVNLVRNGEMVFEGKIASLKRFKDDVKEVGEGFECGIALSGFNDLKEGDIIDAYFIEKIARKL